MGKEGFVAGLVIIYSALTVVFMFASLYFVLGFFGVPLGQGTTELFSFKSAFGAFLTPYIFVALPTLMYAAIAFSIDIFNTVWGYILRIKYDKDGLPISWSGRVAIVFALFGFIILYWTVFPYAHWFPFVFTMPIVLISSIIGWTHSY